MSTSSEGSAPPPVDDPYAPPDPAAPPRSPAPPPFGTPQAGAGRPSWAAPTGPPSPGAPPPRRSTRAVAGVVLGVLALVTSVSVVGAFAFGLPALLLGLVGLRQVRRHGGGRTAPVVAVVTAVLAFAVAGTLLAVFADELERYQDCLAESVSLAADDACRDQLEDDLGLT